MSRRGVVLRATCPACQGPMKTGAKVCTGCRARNVCCVVCLRYRGELTDGRCAECGGALAGLSLAPRRSRKRPEGGEFPPGHMEALAARAAARLPLFEEGAPCPG
jgi:hypothetical protein